MCLPSPTPHPPFFLFFNCASLPVKPLLPLWLQWPVCNGKVQLSGPDCGLHSKGPAPGRKGDQAVPVFGCCLPLLRSGGSPCTQSVWRLDSHLSAAPRGVDGASASPPRCGQLGSSSSSQLPRAEHAEVFSGFVFFSGLVKGSGQYWLSRLASLNAHK